MNEKRLFFGFEALSPWPEKLPVGRQLDPSHRHLTIAFLGTCDFSELQDLLNDLPKPTHLIAMSGLFNDCLFLPPYHKPRVAAWHFSLPPEDLEELKRFYETFCHALFDLGFLREKELRPLLPHVTMARSPFDPKQWKKHFTPLPMVLKDFHLFESIGELRYPSLWKLEIKAPFEEIEHMADIAYLIRGKNMAQIYHNALTALAFRFPPLIHFASEAQPQHLDDIVIALNEIIARADEELGCPFKAVSFHGKIEEEGTTLIWEMIVDV